MATVSTNTPTLDEGEYMYMYSNSSADTLALQLQQYATYFRKMMERYAPRIQTLITRIGATAEDDPINDWIHMPSTFEEIEEAFMNSVASMASKIRGMREEINMVRGNNEELRLYVQKLEAERVSDQEQIQKLLAERAEDELHKGHVTNLVKENMQKADEVLANYMELKDQNELYGRKIEELQ